jgi:hypothetical protein
MRRWAHPTKARSGRFAVRSSAHDDRERDES